MKVSKLSCLILALSFSALAGCSKTGSEGQGSSTDNSNPSPTPTPVFSTPTPTPVPTPTPTPGPEESLFTNQVPDVVDETDGNASNYELGMGFQATKAGKIVAIRYYRGPMESGLHIGRIFSSNGTELAHVTFVGESTSGWQRQNLVTPVFISGNTTYYVTVNTGNTYYPYTLNFFNTQLTNGNLRSSPGANGFYGELGGLPVDTSQNTNYFRDIVFSGNL